MKLVSNSFKNQIKNLGREINVKISYDNYVYENSEINRVNLSYDGAILKSVMKKLEIDSNVEISKDTWVNFKFGVKTFKNLFNKDDYTKHLLIREDGTENPNSTTTSSSNFISVKPNTTYTESFVCNYKGAIFRVHLFDENKEWIQQATSYTTPSASTSRRSFYFSTTNNTRYIRITFRDTATASQNAKDIQIEEGNVATEYQQFGGDYEYIDYGDFKVVNSEKQEDTNSYKLTCYDKMIEFMKDYEYFGITFPITIRNYLIALCNNLGITYGSLFFANSSKELSYDPFLDANNGSLGYTYRDILDQIAEAGGTHIAISNNVLDTLLPNDTSEQIDSKSLKDINVNFGEVYGPINSVVLSRSGESDNIYLRDEESVTENGLCEIKIIDNQIMNDNNRDTYLPALLGSIDGLTYCINDFQSTGICYLDFLDMYDVIIGDNTYNCIMYNDEINIESGLEENINTERPEQSETDYTKADKTDRKINQAYSIVDKQNLTITNLVSQTTQSQQLNDQRILELQERTNSVVQTLTTTNATIEVMQRDILEGQETLRNNLVNIDINGINVSTNSSAIQTLMTNEKFVIKSGNQTLAFFGYDTDTNSTKAEMDNLTVTNYFIAGVHRVETIRISGEERTGWFYIG